MDLTNAQQNITDSTASSEAFDGLKPPHSFLTEAPQKPPASLWLDLIKLACSENVVEAIRDILVDSGTRLNHNGNVVD